MLRRQAFSIGLALLLLGVTSCTKTKGELGSTQNPIKFFLLPSVEHNVLEESGQAIKDYLEAHTKYKYKVSVPTSYIAVVEAFGSKRADVASLNTYGYVLAHQKYKAQARLTVIRNGQSTYQSAIIAHVKSGIKKLSDINGKRFAFVDPTSTSGYILPNHLFKENKIKPKQTIYAQRHDNVISMIYQGQVDAGAIYYSPPEGNDIQDARRLVLTQYPDVIEKIKIVQLTDSIPNDAIVFRHDLPEEIKQTISQGLIDFIATPQGRAALESTFTVSGFKPATDQDYQAARKMFAELEASEQNNPAQ
ncbi:MAG: phosphate/phosphite/phosphonate ABC transporter substrate-binding protein [Bdellovibrionales bacterium]